MTPPAHPAAAKPCTPRALAAAERCRWLGAALVLLGVCLPALNNSTDFPYWDVDLLVASSPMLGLAPAGFMVVSALTALGGALVFLSAVLAREHADRWSLAGVGAVIGAVAWHGWGSPVRTVSDQYVGAAWAAGFIALVALAHACRDERVRSGVGACLLGLIVAQCLKGGVQLAVEHPAMVEHFRANKESLLAAQGLNTDSSMARSYERRLLQPEPTAWFALANVFGTFTAAAAVGLGAFALAWVRRDGMVRRAALAPIALMALACAAMAVASGSKGSLAALALGAVVAGVVFALRRPLSARVLGVVAVACVAAPIAAVAARLVVGERIGELSLLFRGMYWQGAARMVARAPLLGVGPGGFQGAFTVLKPPLCPEDVKSAHNAFVDWWSMLGLAGVAGIAVVMASVIRSLAGVSTERDAPAPAIGPLRPPLRLALGVAAACTIVSAYLEVQASTPLTAATRLGVLAAWGLAAWSIAHASVRVPIRPALAFAALVMLVQSQIEVSATWPPSAGLALALIGAAAARSPTPPARICFAPQIATGVLGVAGLALVVFGVIPAARWESELGRAAALVEPLPGYRLLTPEKLAAALSNDLGRPVVMTSKSLDAAMAEVSAARLVGASEAITRAWGHEPSDWRTGRELSRVLAATSRVPGPYAVTAATAAIEAAERAASLPTARGAAASWAATIWQGIPVPDLAKADRWLLIAHERDPYNASTAYQLARLASERAKPDEARTRAREALRLQEFARLDLVGRGLADAQLVQLRAWAADP